MILLIPLIPLLIYLNDEYGIFVKKRYCKNKTWLSELTYFIHTLLTTYTLLSPFILKDYLHNLFFIILMVITWFIEKMLTGTMNCYLTNLEDRTCGNENSRTGISLLYVVLSVLIIIYDVYKILQI